jgi:hypothetical protein
VVGRVILASLGMISGGGVGDFSFAQNDNLDGAGIIASLGMTRVVAKDFRFAQNEKRFGTAGF